MAVTPLSLSPPGHPDPYINNTFFGAGEPSVDRSQQTPQGSEPTWFARFPRTVDLSERARSSVAVMAAIAARREARKNNEPVVCSIRELAETVGASPGHIGTRILRPLEARGLITRIGGGWTVPTENKNGWYKFPAWVTGNDIRLSRSALVVLLAICSNARNGDQNARITVTYNQLATHLKMNRTGAINCVKELERCGAVIVHRRRAEGCHDYNLPNQYTVCYRRRQVKLRPLRSTVKWRNTTQELLDNLAVDPQWAAGLASEVPSTRYQRRVEIAVGRLADERTGDDLARKIFAGRSLEGAKNIWGVLCHRLDKIPLLHDRDLAQARASARRGEISQAQLALAEEAVRKEHDLFTYRPE